MRHSWIAAAALALVLGLLGGATAGAEGPTPASEEATVPASEEAPPSSEEATVPSSEAAPASSEEEASVLSIGECSNGYACVWPAAFYGGTVGKSLCTGGLHTFGGNVKNSGANWCNGSNKAVWFRSSGTTIQCLNAGTSSAGFWTSVNELWVGAENSHC